MIRFPRERMAIAARGAAAAAAASRSSSGSSRNSIAATASRFLSSTSAASASADDNDNPLSRYGLGGHHWKQFDPNSYQSLISEALSHKVNYLEVAGQDGGDIAMVGAIQSIMERSPHLILDAKQPITITTRVGYRTLIPQSEQQQQQQQHTTTPDEKAPPPQPPLLLPGDVILTEQQMDDEEEGMLAATSANNKSSQKVVHNLSADYIRNAVEKTSPILELFNEKEFQQHFKLVYLIHNPEVQVLEFLKVNPNATMIDRQSYIQQSWQPALDTLQEYCLSSAADTTKNNISFGVVSNGLGIPPELDHPMHLSSDIIVDACKQNNRFTTIQLPANLLERHGINTAKILRKALFLPQQQQVVDIVAMRPLTCYPDLGTGNSHPFRLVDYELPSTGNDNGDDGGEVSSGKTTTQYTHKMTGIPSLYHIALQTTVSHFDAEELLETKLERDLTMEERETLDGCKLVQSMIHDLDSDLDSIRSFAAHEEELYGRIIPLLYDTFEAMDDRTSDVLQAYFAAYALAVRYAIAKKTRQILKHGEDGTNISNGGGGDNNNNKTSITSSLSTKLYPDIPDSMTLQEYALRHMLAASVSVGSDDDDKNDDNDTEVKAFSRIVIGASTLEDFRRQIDLMEYLLKDVSPLDAIDAANNNIVEEEKEE